MFLLYYTTGNDQGFFSIDPATGHLYQIKEIDLETLDEKRFELQVEAAQKDNPVKSAFATVCLCSSSLLMMSHVHFLFLL